MRKIYLLFLIFMLYPALTSALETGDAYWGTFGGYQKGIFSDEDQTKYLGLTSTIYQPTLNWGDHRLQFIGFYRNNDTDQFELGYFSAEMVNFWLSPGYEMDAFLGDGSMRFITPTLIFEHVGLPTQSLRGAWAELRTEWGRTGVQAGRFTEGDFLIPSAVDTVEGDIAGTYLEWQGPDESRIAGAVDFVKEDGKDRSLTSVFGNLPVTFGELRVAGWYDSFSEDIAAVGGIRHSDGGQYAEVGFLHVPEDFNYLDKNTSLPIGESLLFGTYRFNGVRHGYYIEGSGGQIDTSEDRSWLYRGSLGSFYRTSIRDTISGSVSFSYQDANSGSNQTRLRENIRYSLRRSKWDNFLQLQAIQLFDNPADENSSEGNDTLGWLGEVNTSYRSGSWDAGGKFSLEHENIEGMGDQTSALFRLEGRTTTGFGLTGGGFLQYGVGWSDDDRSEVYGGGVDIAFPLPGGWQLRTRLRAQRSNVSVEAGAFSGDNSNSAHTTIDLFAIIERRHYWGEPAPVIGKFVGPKPRGVGDIKGRVYVDMNGNGVFDSEDKPLGGAVLRLDEGFVIETDSQGLYHFPNVSAGEHHLALDPASFPIDYVDPAPEGLSVKIYPRDQKTTDWPLKVLETYAQSPLISR